MSVLSITDASVLEHAGRAISGGKRGGQTRMRTWVIACLLMSGVCLASGVEAEKRTRPVRIGALTASWGPTPLVVGLRDGLLELGYREDQDFVLGVRFTQGDIGEMPAAARQLVRYGVDLLVTLEDAAAKAAQEATTEIPIVFTNVSDPVGMKLIQSFARPGSNITGVTELNIELAPKRLEVFYELVSGLKRALFLYDAYHANAVAWVKAYRDAARRLGVVLVEHAVHTSAEAQATLMQVPQGEIDGILQAPSLSLNLPGRILEFSTQRGIPTMFNAAFWVESGALASYGPDFYASGRQAARLVDKILEGAKPAELPVEVNPKIEFAINLKVAKKLGLTIPPEMVYRADRIVR